ncbi:MAG TPA: helicase-associated domain-containing protein [Anaerolineales bacterium]|nr:helicase-associated domain-containing protein [Anaerolineales bacterium]
MRTQDLGYARIVAELWGLERSPGDMDAELEQAVRAILNEELITEMVEALEPEAREAVAELARQSGRMPWDAFVRRFGEVRDMGAGRRDRERPELRPGSVAEALFYRGLMGRAFFETQAGLREFAYIPDDLLPMIPRPINQGAAEEAPGRRATAAEHAEILPANDRILDEATTLLAALRARKPVEGDPILESLLECAGILREGAPNAERVRAFLEASRTDALGLLVAAWRDCETFDELRLIPGLICEGPWVNQPRAARRFILEQLKGVPASAWWNLKSFVESIKEKRPDFQRPAGDYDSWFIKRAEDGKYLRGFESWDAVDGAFIRFMLTTVMHRLGLIDVAGPVGGSEARAFRRAERRNAGHTENGRLDIGSQGRISAGRDVPRAVRYQLARFCEWEQQGPDEYRFRVTPRSMEGAAKQGLRVEHLLALLAKHGKAGIPASVTRALKRWEQAGTEARTETQVVLRVKRPEIIKELLRSRAGRFLDQALGPTAITVKAGAQDKVIAALAELGLLGEDETGEVVTRPESRSVKTGRGDERGKPGAKITSRK